MFMIYWDLVKLPLKKVGLGGLVYLFFLLKKKKKKNSRGAFFQYDKKFWVLLPHQHCVVVSLPPFVCESRDHTMLDFNQQVVIKAPGPTSRYPLELQNNRRFFFSFPFLFFVFFFSLLLLMRVRKSYFSPQENRCIYAWVYLSDIKDIYAFKS